MLRIEVEARYPQLTLHCRGRLVLGLETEALRSMVRGHPEKELRVNLSGVRTIDAAGLGLLVELQREALERGQRLIITEPSRCVRRLIALMSLDQVLEIADLGGKAAEKLPRTATNRPRVMTA